MNISGEINKNTGNDCYIGGRELGSGEQCCNEGPCSMYPLHCLESFAKWKSHLFKLITFKTHISLAHNDFGESLFLKVSLSQYFLYKIDLFNFSKTSPIVVYCYYHKPHVIGTEAVYYFLLHYFS